MALLWIVGFFLPGNALGQVPGSPEDLPPRMHAGVGLAVAQPLGEFADYVTAGGGIHGFFRIGLDELGIMSLRLHGGFLTYGRETRRVCLSETVSCLIQVDRTTSNNILILAFGPEVGVPLGSVRLYGNASIGLGYLSTDSHLSGIGQDQQQFPTQNYADGGFAWNAGGGVELPLGRIQQVPIALDFGVSYQVNGTREYLTRGDIRINPGGSLDLDVRRSSTDFVLWRLGVSVGIVPVR